MNPSQQGDLYRKAVVSLGYVTVPQLDETIALQSKIGELGLRESLGDLLVKKGYLSESDHTLVLKHIGAETASIPGYTILARLGQGGNEPRTADHVVPELALRMQQGQRRVDDDAKPHGA